MKMKEEMAQMRKQNEMLTQMATNQMSMRLAQTTRPRYTHNGLQKYFQRESNGYRIRKHLREKVVFAQNRIAGSRAM